MHLHEEIRKVAYELYEKSGRIAGCDFENWLAAERIVMARHAQEEKGPKVKTPAASSFRKEKTQDKEPRAVKTRKPRVTKTRSKKAAKTTR